MPSQSFNLSLIAGLLMLIVPLQAARTTRAESADIPMLKDHYVQFLLASPADLAQVAHYLQTLQPDGTWPDINYHDRTRSGWPVAQHLRRLVQMAEAYRRPGTAYSGKPELKAAILTGLQDWLTHDYTNPNWWWNQIGAPKAMADLLVLMDNQVPDRMVQRALKTTLSRSKIGMTGQNKVWLAGIVFVRSLITGDEKQLQAAHDALLAEVGVTTAEGIQPDWSFHQHGPQQQFGNYGLAFGDSITQWALVFRGTRYALDDRQLSIMRNYLLEGPSWMLWNGSMDISGCGRQLYRHCQVSKGRSILRQLERMPQIDPAHAALYQERIAADQTNAANTLVGNRMFWRSDLMVHRRARWYASIKMSSRRVIGSETCNSENMRGLHLGDGTLYLYQTGREYQDIEPFWDWSRLPGTTCDQTLVSLVPGRKQCTLPTHFVGGVSDGRQGVAALDYRRVELTAHKSWFFLKDAIVCLGAGITAGESGPVLTSIQQSLLQSPVTTSSGAASPGKHALRPGDWVDQADIGYLILAGDKPVLQLARQEGDWKLIYTAGRSSPQSGQVFSLWLDHGRAPANRSYAYVIFPRTSPEQMPARTGNPGFRILSNTKDLQAIETDTDVQAVFYAPDQLPCGKGLTIAVSKPCMVIVHTTPTDPRLYVCDPTQLLAQVQVRLSGRSHTIPLPTGGLAGQTVEIPIPRP